MASLDDNMQNKNRKINIFQRDRKSAKSKYFIRSVRPHGTLGNRWKCFNED
jgi:hypothetical protein